MTRRVLSLVAAGFVVLSLGAGLTARAADTGWVIERFASDIEILRDGRIAVNEAIDVDFQALNDRHGIFRDIPIRYRWDPDPTQERVYDLSVQSVRNAAGRSLKYETSTDGANFRIKIGDADQIVTGKQTYRIAYTVRGALNGFPDHDELFWNVNGGEWSVPMRAVSATVRATADAFTKVTCYEGPAGSTTSCQSGMTSQRAEFAATRQLEPEEQLTIVAALRKGVVPEPTPILERRARDPEEWFDATPATLGAAVVVMVAGLWAVVWRWWTAGRDQRERETIVAEFEPPEKIRPAQAGLLIDEQADPKDVTATIVDLAVRGHLRITEQAGQGLLGKKDWLLTRQVGVAKDPRLELYEGTILEGLFASGDEVKLSDLKQHFYLTLHKAQRELYGDSVTRKWFAGDPQRVRQLYVGAGIVALGLAAAAIGGLGTMFGAGLVGVGAIVPAVALLAFAPRMPAKTRDGAELLRRTLGFRRYMEVAEKDRQRFAEKENIFSEYLPYAIVFGCVEKWARAFSGINAAAATAGWYTGSSRGMFQAMDLSSNLSSFSNQVSSTIASTPGGSGSSGFSGGGSGGGGGGGGGGSW